LRAAALALCALLGACAGHVRVAQFDLPVARTELEATPFFPQDVNECGPAALATVLAASGVAVTPDELAPTLYLPGRQGSLQAEVIASARRHARVPYPLRPRLEDLLATVAAGTPVLVLQNLRLRSWPAWHYAVVVGYDGDDDSVILRSGTERRRTMSLRAFERSWSLAERWALAVVTPESPPARAEALPWLQAASAFEELGQPGIAGRAYQAATRRWPAEPLGWQVLANLRYARKDLAGAEDALRQALALAPSAATLNNLAQVLLERGCPAAALAAIERAAALDDAPASETIARTRAQVEAQLRTAKGAPPAGCRGP
jgi:tetratricopeptide (TPR) repeat protein